MACNCATQEQIDALMKKYGEKKGVPKDAPFKLKVKSFTADALVKLGTIIIAPFLFLYVLKVHLSKDNRISLKDFFHLDGSVNQNFTKTIG